MTLKQMHSFFAIARIGNIKAAAAALEISQSVLNKQISEMEFSVGTTLFFRSKSTLLLTPAGKVLYDQLPDLFKQVNNMFSMVSCYRDKELHRGILKIGYEQVCDYHLICDYAKQYKAWFANRHCIIRSYNFLPLLEAVRNGELDVGFAYLTEQEPIREDLQDLLLYSICTEPLVCVIRVQDEAKLLQQQNLSAFSQFCLLCLEKNSECTKSALWACCRMGIIPHVTICQSRQDLLDSIECGNGFFLVPRGALGDFVEVSNLQVSEPKELTGEHLHLMAITRKQTDDTLAEFIQSVLDC